MHVIIYDIIKRTESNRMKSKEHQQKHETNFNNTLNQDNNLNIKYICTLYVSGIHFVYVKNLLECTINALFAIGYFILILPFVRFGERVAHFKHKDRMKIKWFEFSSFYLSICEQILLTSSRFKEIWLF